MIVETAMLLQMTITAMITSMNPSITARQNTGEDSEQVSVLFCKVMETGLSCTCSYMSSSADMPEIGRSQLEHPAVNSNCNS